MCILWINQKIRENIETYNLKSNAVSVDAYNAQYIVSFSLSVYIFIVCLHHVVHAIYENRISS